MVARELSLTEPGAFVVGCNYWASHAGTAMWSDWRPEVVERDLKALADGGLQVLRVFPLWPDFQPITQLRGGGGNAVEIRHGETPLSDDAAGRAGVSEEMIGRFDHFARMAEQNGLRLVVGLITGWMSGRYFVPPALEERNVLTDPLALKWETRFVTYFVERFLDDPAIIAWDLGNECNCLGSVNRDGAWAWTSAIVNAIRSVDPERPIVSGMHGLQASPEGAWTIEDQAELTDLLTTHPYPIFTAHCDLDPINTMRGSLHADAESRMCADIGGKPCLVEEVNTLGPMLASEAVAGDFARVSLYSLWAHDCHGFLWWCGHDQRHLAHAPYDWHALERELGLLREDRTAKPAFREIGDFRGFLDGLPFEHLPPRTTEAVCILSHGQDHWAVAYNSFVLAKQAGFDIAFQHETQPIKEAALYLVPSACGARVMNRKRWHELLDRVRGGAVLYLSYDNAFFDGFEELTGLEIVTRARRAGAADITMEGLPDKPVFRTDGAQRLVVKPTRAELLGREADGNPAFACAAFGKGKVYFLGFPLEKELASRPGAFDGPEARPYWRIYEKIAAEACGGRVVSKAAPTTGLTEHPFDDNSRLIIAVNYAPEPHEAVLALAKPWTVGEVHRGKVRSGEGQVACSLGANDDAVFMVKKG